MADTEQWRPVPVPGFERRYQVSSAGRVRGVERCCHTGNKYGTPATRRVPAKVIATVTDRGYLAVGLWANGRKRTRHVHTLVLEAFTGPRPAGCHAQHIDGDRTNNALSNLLWSVVEEQAAA